MTNANLLSLAFSKTLFRYDCRGLAFKILIPDPIKKFKYFIITNFAGEYNCKLLVM